ncbi:MAG: DUF2238 domain-containing protein [Arenimonas sp.]
MSRQIASPVSGYGAAADTTLRNESARYPLILLTLFIAWWSVLAIAPWYRQDWLLENVLVFIIVPWLIWSYGKLRLSNFSYTMIFIFFCLHEVGAHYTYAEVPLYSWAEEYAGLDLAALQGSDRNHFDRLVHFLYGFLLLPSIVEIFEARANLRKIWRFIVPVCFMMAFSEMFEIVEWQAAEIFGGDLGQAYLGSQGDIWDAQKDSLAAAIGAVISTVLYHAFKKFRTNSQSVGDTPSPSSRR